MTDSRASSTTEKRVSSNALSYMAGQAAMAVFGFVSGIVLARYLPKNVFGQYSYLLALAILFLPVLDLGGHSFYAALASRDRARIGAYWARAIALKIYALPLAAALLAGYFVLLGHMPGGLFNTVLFYVVAQSLLLSTDIVFRAAEQGRAWAIRRTIYELVSLALVLVAVTLLDARTAATLLLFASIAVAVAAAWAIVASVRITGLTWAQFASALRKPFRRMEIAALLPFAMSTLLWVLFYRETNILLEYLGTRVDLADYRVAFLVMTAALYLPRAITWASVPRIALHHAQLDDAAFRQMMSKAVRANFYIAAFVVTAGALYGERLIGIAFGPKYLHLGLMWQVSNLLLGAMFVLQFCMDLLNALHQEKRLAYALVAGIAVLTVLDITAIPRYGTAGGVAAQLAACAVILPIGLVPFLRWVPPSAILAPALRLAAVVVLCGAAGFVLRRENFYLSLIVFTPLFAAVSHYAGAMPQPITRLLRRLLARVGIDFAPATPSPDETSPQPALLP